MKSLLTILALVFTVMFSSTSSAEWTKTYKGGDGTTFYVDFERIRKVEGYVYFWELADYLKPKNSGVMSGIIYVQGDCKLFRYQILSYVFQEERMGLGSGIPYNPKNPEWKYAPPNTPTEHHLKLVCSR